jgi:hypothetical protein
MRRASTLEAIFAQNHAIIGRRMSAPIRSGSELTGENDVKCQSPTSALLIDHLIRADQEGGRHSSPRAFAVLQDAANAVRQSLPRAGNGVRNAIFASVAKVT